ncbi:MAG: hypothetical protein Q8P76_01450 [bacterium]|nr:hypothetical protein [bacterium]
MANGAGKEATGNIAENMVEEVLLRRKHQGDIAGYIRNIQNDLLDKEGIDFLIFFNNGFALPLQVKIYNKKYWWKKLKRHRRNHPMVRYVLAVNIHDYTRDEALVFIDRFLRSAIKSAQRHPA